MGWALKPTNMAKPKTKGSKPHGCTPKCFTKHTWWAHTRLGQMPNKSVGCAMGWAHINMHPHEVWVHTVDTHEHAPTQCAMAAPVWQGMPEWVTHPGGGGSYREWL